MNKKLFSMLLIAVVLLSACSVFKPAPAPTQAPTLAPTKASVESTAEEPAAVPGAFGASWETTDCSAFGVPSEVAAQADCGYVTVPENRAAGNDKTIKLAVVRVRSTSATPGTPVIEGTGGPGGASLDGAQNILKESAGILADRDWIFFSQRGTQYAQPWLDCKEYNEVPLEAAKNGLSMDEELAHLKDAIQTCIDDFKAQGVDLTGYNSVENAEDINAIRQALGYDKIIYYGQSYGTLLGQFLMRTHPEIVEAIILDGIAPASAKHWTEVTDFAAAFQNVFATCAKDEACHAAFPDPEGALAKGLEGLKTNPPSIEIDAGNGQKVTVKASESLVMNTLFLLLYINSGLLPETVYQFSQGNVALLSQLAPLVLSNDVARLQHLAMVCSDDPVNSLGEADLDNVPEMYRDLVRYDAVNYVNGCGILKLPQLPDSSDELIQLDIPALLLQGGLDPATPVKAGNLVEPGLTKSYNVIVPAGAHIQLHSPCVQSIMKAFMNDPQTAPDTSCVDPTIPFSLPQAVPTPQAPVGFSDAWQPVSCDTFKLSKDMAESSDCGYVTVPEQHENPDGPAFQLGVVRVRSIGENLAPDPLFMEQGGPGGSTIQIFTSVLPKMPRLLELLKTRDIVLVEQRGTQFSKPYLNLPEENAHKLAVAKGEASEDDYSYMETYAKRMDAEGINLSAFTSKQNAADIYSVAEALGYDQFNYYGVSYGTLLGQYVMDQAADHPGMLRSAILDSVVPIDFDEDSLKDQAASSAMRSFFAACAQDAACSRDFPDLGSKVMAKADELNAKPAEITLTLPDGTKVQDTFSGSDLTRLIFDTLYSTDKTKMLPAHLDALVNRDDYTWAEASKSAEFTPGIDAGGMHLAMKCPRFDNYPGDPPDLFETAYPQVDIVAPEMASYNARCELIPAASAGADEYVYPGEDIPALVLNGSLDPATPPVFGEYVGSNLATAYVFTLPDTGHGVLISSPTDCPGLLAQQFLADPTRTPDGSCTKDLKPIFFGRVTPVDELTLEPRTVAEGITANVPTQWADVKGYFYDPNDPINTSTGLLQFNTAQAESPEAAIQSIFSNAKIIASDQPLGNYRWTIAESSMVPNKLTRVAAALLPDGKTVVMVKLLLPVEDNAALIAALWEPVLSSVSVAAK